MLTLSLSLSLDKRRFRFLNFLQKTFLIAIWLVVLSFVFTTSSSADDEAKWCRYYHTGDSKYKELNGSENFCKEQIDASGTAVCPDQAGYTMAGTYASLEECRNAIQLVIKNPDGSGFWCRKKGTDPCTTTFINPDCDYKFLFQMETSGGNYRCPGPTATNWTDYEETAYGTFCECAPKNHICCQDTGLGRVWVFSCGDGFGDECEGGSTPPPDGTTLTPKGVAAYLASMNPVAGVCPNGKITLGCIVSIIVNKIVFPIATLLLFLMIVWGGYKIVMGGFNGQANIVELGKRRILGAVLGFLLLGLVYWIWLVVQGVLGVKIT